MRLGIAVSEHQLSAVMVRRGRIVWAAETSYADADDLARALAALAAERPKGAREAAVALGSGVARLKTVEGLPRLRRTDLVAHVRLNSRRYFLQNGIPLVTDALPMKPRADTAAQALLAGAPVPTVDAVISGLDAAGLRCRLMAPVELMGPSIGRVSLPDGLSTGLRDAVKVTLAREGGISLLPDASRERRRGDERRSLRRWAMAACLSVMLAGLSWIAAQLRAERFAGQELARLKPSIEAALSARRDLEATDQALATVAGLEAASTRRARLLAELTRVLPDSAFLVSVRFDADGSGNLSGYAPRAAAIVARLERAALVRNATLDGSVTREIVGGRELERFSLRFHAAGGAGKP